MKKYLTLNDLARIFNASPATLKKRVDEGILVPYKKTKKGYLFDPEKIRKLEKVDIVRKFNLRPGYQTKILPPTKRELNFLKKYILNINRTKMAEKLEISKQRLHQKASSVAYRNHYFKIINERN